uniref:Fibrinogen silencer binding protein n=1 Tax=Hucho hucho TaxID=62062 RepID=A0A4W5M2E6_9TELE
MVGKARSSNFTLSEKLDLLKLVRPHIRILEEHTNKHAVIVDKNKCWDTVSEQYNVLGGDRPPRTAQGLRTLYKRLKESAKQEVMQRRHAQPEYRGSISEPTRRVMEMIPHLFHHRDVIRLDQDVVKLDQDVVRLDQDVDVKPPPDLTILSTRVGVVLGGEGAEEEDEELGSVHGYDGSLSPCPSSVVPPLSTSPVPLQRDLYHYDHYPRPLQLAKEEHEQVMTNHRKMGVYLEEKREGQKRKQELEEELLRAKIKVEKLRVARLRHGLPLPL